MKIERGLHTLEAEYCGHSFRLASSCVHDNSSFYYSKGGASSKVVVWDEVKIGFFNSLIREDFNVVDIGASYGAYTMLAKFHPKTNWFAFEPNLKILLAYNMSNTQESSGGNDGILSIDEAFEEKALESMV